MAEEIKKLQNAVAIKEKQVDKVRDQLVKEFEERISTLQSAATSAIKDKEAVYSDLQRTKKILDDAMVSSFLSCFVSVVFITIYAIIILILIRLYVQVEINSHSEGYLVDKVGEVIFF